MTPLLLRNPHEMNPETGVSMRHVMWVLIGMILAMIVLLLQATMVGG